MPVKDTAPVTTRVVQSADGTQINYCCLGKGPGLVIMPASMCSATDYLRLARPLADSFTLYIVDRRGHGASGPIAAGHAMATECEDLAAVLGETKARYLFGHSIGGLISLQTSLASSLDKLAVYEPPLSVDGSIATNWLPQMQQALARKKYATAMATIMKSLELSGDAGKLPKGMLTALIALMMRFRKGEHGESWGQHIISLLPTMATDIQLVRELDSTQQRFRAQHAPTLLLDGAKTAPHFRLAVQTLAKILPHAQHITLPGLEHSAPNQDAPEVVAKELRKFFTAQ